MYLDLKLETYGRSDYYPFHMPGHKRAELDFADPYSIDITEIEGFDNLHHAQDIILEAQKRAAKLFGAEDSFYLINGSTCGILAAVSACVKSGDRILMARNSHKAAYHAAFINQLQVNYLYPGLTDTGIQGAVRAEDVEKAFDEAPDIKAVFITSPTYDGVVSDVEAIAKIAHQHRVPLIVDEAHGAHFGFNDKLPKSAISCGADIVIQSLHKTLPSFTQTAILHVMPGVVDKKAVKKYLGIYETSSPSYILMAGIDKCVRILEENRTELFAEYVKRLEAFYSANEDLKAIHVINRCDMENDENVYDWDFGKILIVVDTDELNGEELYQILLKKYHLQMEMCAGNYVTAMTSIMDRDEGFDRLTKALHEIDSRLERSSEHSWQGDFVRETYTVRKKKLEIYQAEALPNREVKLTESKGLMSGEFVYLYPPGIPLIVPGEVIDEQLLSSIRKCKALGLRVEGMEDAENRMIQVVNF